MQKKLFALALTLISITAQAYKQTSLDIIVNGQTRNMVVFTPDVTKSNMPLFIVTHGMNQSPEYQYGADKMYELIDTAKFVVTYLRSDGSTWDTGGTKDQNFVLQTITEMQSRYGCDVSRVYWSGFSMGSMLIYHCMPNVLDKIAAFAPTSGIQFSEQPWNNLKKPVNLIHCHAYGDDVFGYEQYGIRDYVTHFATYDNANTYTKTTGYHPYGAWFDGDKEMWKGGTNNSEVEFFSYNNGGHWPMAENSKEIWNFCRRFSLFTPLQTYLAAYNDAVKMVETWANDADINGKQYYKTLKALTVNLAPDEVDQTDETKLTSTATRLRNAMANLETIIRTTIKTSKEMVPEGFDPNFHIYLAFGQSNMEGNATPLLEDYAGVGTRFFTLAAVNMSSCKRTQYHWYAARPPLCRNSTGLTPLDYFGRRMEELMPDSIRIGVANVALGGAAIEMFQEEGIAEYIAKQEGWLQNYAHEYDDNPFRALVNLGKEAQKVGVIKGILLHQGESNNCQSDWPQKVKRVYQQLMRELGLNEEDCPLLAGEMLSQASGGVCYGHNSVIATLPKVIPTAHVVSSNYFKQGKPFESMY